MHAVETMAFANALPWHGLGNRVSDNITADEMLVEAGLDWSVNKSPIHTVFTDSTGMKRQRTIKGKKAMVRSTDNEILSIVSDSWHPVQNAEIMGFFKSYTEAMGAKMETAGSLKGGRIVWGLANLGKGFMVGAGDEVGGYLLLTGSHESGRSTQARVTSIRVVCANTLGLALEGKASIAYRQDHTKPFDSNAAKDQLGLYTEILVDAEKDFNSMLKLKVTDSDAAAFLAKFFMPKAPEVEAAEYAKKIGDQTEWNRRLADVMISYKSAPGAVPGSAWGLMNAVTHWADHAAGRASDTRMSSAWLGANADLKERVRKDLLEMAS